jgi:hypothetical protein
MVRVCEIKGGGYPKLTTPSREFNPRFAIDRFPLGLALLAGNGFDYDVLWANRAFERPQRLFGPGSTT